MIENKNQKLVPIIDKDDKHMHESYFMLNSSKNKTLQKMLTPQTYEQYSSEFCDKNQIIYAILAKPDSADLNHFNHVGNITLKIDRLNQTGKISIFVWEQGKNYGSTAIRLLTKHCFNRLNINRLEAGTCSTNIPCIKAFKRAGFTIEAILKEAIFFEGSIKGLHIMSLLKKHCMYYKEEE